MGKKDKQKSSIKMVIIGTSIQTPVPEDLVKKRSKSLVGNGGIDKT